MPRPLYGPGDRVLLQDGTLAIVCLKVNSPFRGLTYLVLREGHTSHDHVEARDIHSLATPPAP
jgi:hypothetical protein